MCDGRRTSFVVVLSGRRLARPGDALSLYEPDAAFVVAPGAVVTGHEAIGDFEGFAALRPSLRGDIEQVIYAGDVALVANRWVLEGTTPDDERVRLADRSADVLRRASSGDWRIAIDDPWGGGE
jgi:ketosteroid isomerase-like protein